MTLDFFVKMFFAHIWKYGLFTYFWPSLYSISNWMCPVLSARSWCAAFSPSTSTMHCHILLPEFNDWSWCKYGWQKIYYQLTTDINSNTSFLLLIWTIYDGSKHRSLFREMLEFIFTSLLNFTLKPLSLVFHFLYESSDHQIDLEIIPHESHLQNPMNLLETTI
jgi:hypothetical protein